MRRKLGPWLATALLLAAGSASADEVSDRDRFELWNDCRPLSLEVVDGLSEDADAIVIGLTEDAIEAAVRSRLRTAQLHSRDENETAWSFLFVNVNVVGSSFVTILEYYKPVRDQATELVFTSATWTSGASGVHVQDSNYILSSVRYKIDHFIDEYLRVNEDSCK